MHCTTLRARCRGSADRSRDRWFRVRFACACCWSDAYSRQSGNSIEQRIDRAVFAFHGALLLAGGFWSADHEQRADGAANLPEREGDASNLSIIGDTTHYLILR